MRACSCCADGLLKRPLVEPGVGEEGTREVTMEMIRLELQRTAANVERMDSLGQDLGDISSRSAHLDEMRQSMVTHDAYNRLFNQLRELEARLVGVDELQRGR